jgi:hypothetical protein
VRTTRGAPGASDTRSAPFILHDDRGIRAPGHRRVRLARQGAADEITVSGVSAATFIEQDMKIPRVNAKNTRCHAGRAMKTLRSSSKFIGLGTDRATSGGREAGDDR